MQNDTITTGNFASVNGIKMYYEISGEGKPLILIHGGGSTIQTSFGVVLPLLAKHYKVIAVELQAHDIQATEMHPKVLCRMQMMLQRYCNNSIFLKYIF